MYLFRQKQGQSLAEMTFVVLPLVVNPWSVCLSDSFPLLCFFFRWYRLNSKTGKKEKERGDIQVTVQFTRNNLTASMYDLVMKDKTASTFGKLKERMRGKRRSSEEDSSSAVLPGGYGSLYRMRQRLPSDGGGEEDYEDDEGGEVRRSKMRTFFLRGKLRKSSDTRSSTSLGSESSESSSRGGSLSPTAGISVVVSDLSNSPSNSSNLTVDNSPGETHLRRGTASFTCLKPLFHQSKLSHYLILLERVKLLQSFQIFEVGLGDTSNIE